MSVQMVIRDSKGETVKIVGGTIAERAAVLTPEPNYAWTPRPAFTFPSAPVPSCRAPRLELTA